MKPISDNLFIFLTLNIVNNNHNIDDYVNRQDGKIYVVKGRDNELYFIINGKFKTTSDNEIDYAKSDTCVFGRNSRTDKVTPLDTKKLKECIDEADIVEYAKELKEIFFEYVNTRKIKSYDDIRSEFTKKVQEAEHLMQRAKHGTNEDLIEYAKRIVNFGDKIIDAYSVIEAKKAIEKLWNKALYNPNLTSKIDSIIKKIMIRHI